MPTGKNLAYSVMVLAVLFSLFPLAPAMPAGAAQAPHPGNPPELIRAEAALQSVSGSGPLLVTQEWNAYILGSDLGLGGLFVSDIDNDGKNELIGTENSNAWFVLRETTPGEFRVVWMSPVYPTRLDGIYVRDIDHDGIAEIFVSLAGPQLRVYRGSDFQQIGSFQPAFIVADIVVADTNGDGKYEILLSGMDGLAAYDARTYQHLWTDNYHQGQITVGNVDSDPALEIVLNTGVVLNSATRAEKWKFDNSFGLRIRLGDLDGDGIDEIVGADSSKRVRVLKATSQSVVWEFLTSGMIDALALADIDGDNRMEIIYGDGGSSGYIHGVDFDSRKELWKVLNPKPGLTNIVVADLDQDLTLELIWGAGRSTPFQHNLYMVNIPTLTEKWHSEDRWQDYVSTAIGDVDDDGEVEIIKVNSSQNGGLLSIYDAVGHELEWQTNKFAGMNVTKGIRSIRIHDVDDDGETEFILAATNLNNGFIQVYNGHTRALERQSREFLGTAMTAMEIGDVDGDGKPEIVAGQERLFTTATGPHVIVMDGATLAVKWQSANMNAYASSVYDIHLADVDGDGQIEVLAALNGGAVIILDGATGETKAVIPTQALAITSADLDGNSSQTILVGTQEGQVEFYSGQTHQIEKTASLGTGPVLCLSMAYFDLDASLDILVCQGNRLAIYKNGGQSLFWRSAELGANLGAYNHAAIGEIDNDSPVEILVGSQRGVHQFESSFSPLGNSTFSVSQLTASAGDRLEYTITLINAMEDALPSVQLVNYLPDSLRFVASSLAASSGNAAISGGKITWEGPLAGFSSAVITYQADIYLKAPREKLVNPAEVSAGIYSHTLSAETTLPFFLAYLPAITAPCPNFSDNFSNPASGWWTGSNSDQQIRYLSGEYQIKGMSEYIYAVAAPTCVRQSYTVQVDVRKHVGQTDHGLIFGLNDNWTRYYLFAVDPDTRRYLLLYYDFFSTPKFTVIQYAQSGAIKTWVNYNRLKVIRNGKKITLYINEVKLGDWTHSGTQGETQVGLFTAPSGGGADSRFDNFSVTLMSTTAITASEAEEAVSVGAAAAEETDRPYHLQEVYPRDR